MTANDVVLLAVFVAIWFGITGFAIGKNFEFIKDNPELIMAIIPWIGFTSLIILLLCRALMEG